MMHEELIEQCKKQNPRAQKQLYELVAGKMMAVCLRYAGNATEAEDLLQDGMLKVYVNLEQYKGLGSFEGWIRRTIVNTCLDALRRKNELKYAKDIDEVFDLSSEDELPIDKMACEELMNLIQQIPTGYRTVFNLFAIEGYSHKEIADELNVTESTSKSQFRKARIHLQKMIENEKVSIKE